jgi:hypothetical protein
MRIVIDFMFNKIVDEVMVKDGIGFVRFFATSFVIGLISYTTMNLG